jgi:hypothetical protein
MRQFEQDWLEWSRPSTASWVGWGGIAGGPAGPSRRQCGGGGRPGGRPAPVRVAPALRAATKHPGWAMTMRVASGGLTSTTVGCLDAGVCRAGWYFPPGEGIGRTRPGAGSRPRRGRFRPQDRLRRAIPECNSDRSPDRSAAISRTPDLPRIGPCRGPLIPPLMGPPGGGGPGGAGLGLFALVRRSAGQGHGQKPPVTLPRYATLESARSIDRPSMGLLRRPTPGEIMEGGRLGRPCGPGALRAQLENPGCGCTAISSSSDLGLSRDRLRRFEPRSGLPPTSPEGPTAA